MARHGTVQHSSAQCGTVQHSSACSVCRAGSREWLHWVNWVQSAGFRAHSCPQGMDCRACDGGQCQHGCGAVLSDTPEGHETPSMLQEEQGGHGAWLSPSPGSCPTEPTCHMWGSTCRDMMGHLGTHEQESGQEHRMPVPTGTPAMRRHLLCGVLGEPWGTQLG